MRPPPVQVTDLSESVPVARGSLDPHFVREAPVAVHDKAYMRWDWSNAQHPGDESTIPGVNPAQGRAAACLLRHR